MPSSNSNLFMVDVEGTELSEIEREIIKHPIRRFSHSFHP